MSDPYGMDTRDTNSNSSFAQGSDLKKGSDWKRAVYKTGQAPHLSQTLSFYRQHVPPPVTLQLEKTLDAPLSGQPPFQLLPALRVSPFLPQVVAASASVRKLTDFRSLFGTPPSPSPCTVTTFKKEHNYYRLSRSTKALSLLQPIQQSH